MRKLIVSLVVVGLAAGLVAAPAAAKKKKKTVHETYSAQAFPFVNLAATGTAERSCFAGQEGIHKVSQEFTAPFAGTLTASMEGFTGDWDLAVIIDEIYVYSINDQLTAGAAAEEHVILPLKAKQTVTISACNYAGHPNADVHYMLEGK